jgi:hypothetical protein
MPHLKDSHLDLSINLPPAITEQIRSIAKKQERTFSSVCQSLLEQGMLNSSKEEHSRAQ